MENISEEDILYVENIVATEMEKRLSEKCKRLNIQLTNWDKTQFFNNYVRSPADFKFSEIDRLLIFRMSQQLKNVLLRGSTDETIIEEMKLVKKRSIYWFSEHNGDGNEQPNQIKAPTGSQNFLSKMMEIAKKNSSRPKNGFRYTEDFKRWAVYNRLISGPSGYKSLQFNLKGCCPSISTTNAYVHRSDHAVIEGQLRANELLVYLKERDMPMVVALSEDATSVQNRIQFDSKTNQLIGFVLPTDESNGMPIPFVYKARTATEILEHFAKDIPISYSVNVIMAQPLGSAPAFCLLVFGSCNKYKAMDVAKRWNYIAKELEKIGITVLIFSSDSDTKYNSAMRFLSGIEHSSKEFGLNGIFKCGTKLCPPFYVQDSPHILTKLRNLFLKTKNNKTKLPFGKFYIRHEHLNQLLETEDKSKHLLSATDLNPVDRQRVDSALKICDEKVRQLLKKRLKNSDGTVLFLQIMSDVVAAFMDQTLSPIDRVEKIWKATFLVRMWRQNIMKKPGATLKNNFMSAFCFYCIELNAHSLVFILLYLKKNNLTQLFFPHMLCSQPCESFFRLVRSLTTVFSTVVNFSLKEILNRISRIQLLSEISNDKGTCTCRIHLSKSANYFKYFASE